ncbi:YidB family protein [Streptomyces sp. NRRL S-241]|uniref:YidB family protein n=1 Tax=Streptomyces sp. NRRL S-241 TaxID=1463896 RepID=UPI000560016D|nr:YidB family protein [Streptomyces sp. NRRL S-241]
MAGNDLGSLLGGLLGGGGSGGQGGSGGAGNILGALLSALTGAGGGASGGAGGGASGAQAGGNNPLGGLMDMLTKSGLADQAQSWLGTGDNKPVSGAQIAEAVPDDALQKAAAQAGVSPQEAADQIAQALPTAVDRLSPEGQLPSGSLEDIIRQQKF